MELVGRVWAFFWFGFFIISFFILYASGIRLLFLIDKEIRIRSRDMLSLFKGKKGLRSSIGIELLGLFILGKWNKKLLKPFLFGCIGCLLAFVCLFSFVIANNN